MEEVQEKTKWNELRNKLNNDYTYSEDWELAIQLFNRRIENKFFNPIQEIINTKKLKGEGFTIVTAQCGLIESLAAFRKGKIFNHSKNAASPQYEYKKSAEIFVDFLQNQDIFKNNFYQIEPNGDKTLNVPFSAKDFYQDVRCGLLHEARTKNNWVINATAKDVKTEKCFLEKDGIKIKIYRTILHHRLKDYIKSYSDELRDTSEKGMEIRRFFGRKLDHLFEFDVDNNFEWWR